MRSAGKRRGWAVGAAAGIALVCGAAEARAQYALDKNLQVGSGGINAPGRNIADEARFRNAIVTGNAPGGISFRGDVGYRAPGEFRGLTGSDANFGFRRDSVVSGLGGLGIRGTDALQYQFALTVGDRPPEGLLGLPIYNRVGASATTGAMLHGTGTVPQIDSMRGVQQLRALRPEDDTRGLSLSAMRSPSAFVANRSLQPTLIGRADLATGGYRAMTASSLRGVSFDDYTGFDRRYASEKDAEKAAKPESPTAAPSTQLNDSATPTANPKPAPNQIKSAYEELLERVKANAPEEQSGPTTIQDILNPDKKPPADIRPAWQKRIEELRKELNEEQNKRAKPETPDAKAAPGPGDKKPDDGKKGDDKDPKKPDPERERRNAGRFDEETVAMLRDSAGQITRLAPPSFDAYGTHMKLAQEYLASGRFFDAEEQFIAALSAKAGDPMAAIGRVHAELGAGLFLSGSMNLRALLLEHPEIAGVKYAPELLPSKQLTEKVMSRLNELASESGSRARDPALLLAYLGYQTGNTEAVRHGLLIAAGEGGGDPLARLSAFLTEVWTKPPAPKPAAPTPPTAPTPEK